MTMGAIWMFHETCELDYSSHHFPLITRSLSISHNRFLLRRPPIASINNCLVFLSYIYRRLIFNIESLRSKVRKSH